jgi:sec-independent protein translocase protein TatC
VGTWILACGIVFELPLVLAFLAKIGIATPEFLRQHRRYAILGILIVSAVITPPDVMSQLLMAAPLMLLYEIGIIVTRFTYRPSSLF